MTKTLREKFEKKFNFSMGNFLDWRDKLTPEIIAFIESEIEEAEAQAVFKVMVENGRNMDFVVTQNIQEVLDKCVLEEEDTDEHEDFTENRAFERGWNAYRAKILEIRKEYDSP